MYEARVAIIWNMWCAMFAEVGSVGSVLVIFELDELYMIISTDYLVIL